MPPWLSQSPVVAGAKVGDVRLESTTSLTWDGCRPANIQYVFTTASFEYDYRGPIYVAEFLKLSKALSLLGWTNTKEKEP